MAKDLTDQIRQILSQKLLKFKNCPLSRYPIIDRELKLTFNALLDTGYSTKQLTPYVFKYLKYANHKGSINITIGDDTNEEA